MAQFALLSRWCRFSLKWSFTAKQAALTELCRPDFVSVVDALLAEAARIRSAQDLASAETEPALREFGLWRSGPGSPCLQSRDFEGARFMGHGVSRVRASTAEPIHPKQERASSMGLRVAKSAGSRAAGMALDVTFERDRKSAYTDDVALRRIRVRLRTVRTLYSRFPTSLEWAEARPSARRSFLARRVGRCRFLPSRDRQASVGSSEARRSCLHRRHV